MGKLLDQALSPACFGQAWKRLRNDKAPWRNGLSRTELENDLVFHLLELIAELRSGGYRTGPLRQFAVAKADGGRRVLSAFFLRDKLAQRAVLGVLEPIGERLFHQDSFGYRPGRNVEQALGRVRERVRCGLAWLVDADIARFFDNIPHRPLRKALAGQIPDRALLRLIDAWLDAGVSHAGLFAGRRGISQGAVISPFLCNLYLHQLDEALASHDIPFVRFADDFLLFAPDRPHAERALAFARQFLQTLGLELHSSKTRIAEAGPHVSFLGEPLPPPPAKPSVSGTRRDHGVTRSKPSDARKR
jgi:RNA-directed DNA polymerase